MIFIFTGPFPARFRRNIHDSLTEGNSCLSRSYNVQVENAVIFERKVIISCTYAFGERRMNNHHTITEKICRDATKSHPYISRHLDNGIVVVQSKCNYTRSAQCMIKLFAGYLWLLNMRDSEFHYFNPRITFKK